MYVDDQTKHSDKFSPTISNVSVIAHKRAFIAPYSSVPISSTPYATPSFSPAPAVSPARGGAGAGSRTPFLARKPPPHHSRGFGVKKALTDYLGVDVAKGKNCNKNGAGSPPIRDPGSPSAANLEGRKEGRLTTTGELLPKD